MVLYAPGIDHPMAGDFLGTIHHAGAGVDVLGRGFDLHERARGVDQGPPCVHVATSLATVPSCPMPHC